MFYIRLSDNYYPLTLEDIRNAHPNIGIPDDPSDRALNPLGYAVVVQEEKPDIREDQTAILKDSPDSDRVVRWEVRYFTEDEVEDQKNVLKSEIDSQAEETHNRYTKFNPGQVMTYQEKLQEAKDYKLTPDSSYPLLEVESKITNQPLNTIADNVLSEHSQWVEKASEIESIRQSAKYKIDSTTKLPDATPIRNEAIDQFNGL